MMKDYIDRLSRLDVSIDEELLVDLILGSLTHQFEPIILNVNMDQLKMTEVELLNVLRIADTSFNSTDAVFAI